jgi:hypothetical protein
MKASRTLPLLGFVLPLGIAAAQPVAAVGISLQSSISPSKA